jgi:arylsulfatase A-like enzyme
MKTTERGTLGVLGCSAALVAVLISAATLPACGKGSRPPAPPQTAAASRVPAAEAPQLVVIIVDQLAGWMMAERLGALSPQGGFARLRRDGIFFPELRYEHATTSTAPGHAALFTGLPPVGSGVYANERPHPTTRKTISILADATTREVLEGQTEQESSSAALIRAALLADVLRVERPRAPILSLSLKDRAAVMGGGSHPTASIWFNPARGKFVTSTAFARALPTWVSSFNTGMEDALSGTWRALDETWLKQHAATDDQQQGEGDLGLGTSLPYDLSKAEKPGFVFRATPLADAALLKLASAGLLAHADDGPGMLVISLSSLDYVGHVYGPDSWESWDALRRVDLLLGEFLNELERRFQGRFSLLLTGDHGTTVLPETAHGARARTWCQDARPDYFERPCDAGGRLFRDALENALRTAAKAALGDGDFILGVVEPFVYFTDAATALEAAQLAKLEAACVAALQTFPPIARVFITREMGSPCPPASDESLGALVCRSLAPGAGQLYIVTRNGSFFDPNLARGHGINHGTPYLYDRIVPLFIRTAERSAAGTVVPIIVSPADFTATAAHLLQVPVPSGALQGRPLVQLAQSRAREARATQRP